LTVNGSAVPTSSGPTLGTEQSTASGTSFTFGSIPSGTKMIIVMLEGCSLDSTQQIDIELGDAGGIETASYVCTAMDCDGDDTNDVNTETAAFGLRVALTAGTVSGTFILTLKDSANFTWVCTALATNSATGMCITGGHKSLSAELTQLRLNGNASNFDAGSVNILYF
jgi:hypothetical protein